MTKMQKVVLLLSFYFSPDSEAKRETWTAFTSDRPMDEEEVLQAVGLVCRGTDTLWPHWEALDEFTEETKKALA